MPCVHILIQIGGWLLRWLVTSRFCLAVFIRSQADLLMLVWQNISLISQISNIGHQFFILFCMTVLYNTLKVTPNVWLKITPLTTPFMKEHHAYGTPFVFATTSSHQLLNRDRDSAALPWHQPWPVYPLLPVSCMAVRMPGEDHAPQVLSLCSQKWSDPCWRPQGENEEANFRK